jgi:hypothetical protein
MIRDTALRFLHLFWFDLQEETGTELYTYSFVRQVVKLAPTRWFLILSDVWAESGSVSTHFVVQEMKAEDVLLVSLIYINVE